MPPHATLELIALSPGNIDPWHALSVLKNQSRSELAILINGTSHCANMNPSKPSDPLPLVLAREVRARWEVRPGGKPGPVGTESEPTQTRTWEPLVKFQ